MALLDVKSLTTYFYTDRGIVRAVEGVSYHVDAGEIIALVGESGCGKTVSVYSIMQLIQPPGKIMSGEVHYGGRDLLKLSSKDMSRIRGKEISLVFQEPTAAFDPLYTVGHQISEVFLQHKRNMDKRERRRKTIELLEMVNIPDADKRVNSYPFELSGGMLQRVMIALAMSCEPRVLIADEPTTNLDATTQLQVLETMLDIVKREKTSLILITHNLGLVSRYASKVYVMYAGKVVESTTVEEIYLEPLHPYTQALWASIPCLDRSKSERLILLEGSPPSLVNLPQGCSFAPRCNQSRPICFKLVPPLAATKKGHTVACHKYRS